MKKGLVFLCETKTEKRYVEVSQSSQEGRARLKGEGHVETSTKTVIRDAKVHKTGTLKGLKRRKEEKN